MITRGKPFTDLAGKYLLLDTNVLIDSQKFPNIFRELFSELKSSGSFLVTIPAVVTEYLRGAHDINDLHKLKDYVDQLCDAIVANKGAGSDLSDHLIDPEFILAYHLKANKKSYVDFLLARMLKQHLKSTYLLTRNHSDFHCSIFDRVNVVALDHDSDIMAYGIYQFSPEKYKILLTKILSR